MNNFEKHSLWIIWVRGFEKEEEPTKNNEKITLRKTVSLQDIMRKYFFRNYKYNC